MKRFLLLLGLLWAIYLYMVAPEPYSLYSCYSCFFLFIVAFVILFKERCRYNLICFEFVFSLVFFFTNYAYPLFCYPIIPHFSLFTLEFPEEYINSGCALATIGYIAFCLGCLKYKVLDQIMDIGTFTRKFRVHSWYKPVTNVLSLLLIFSLIPILLSGVYDGNWGEGAIYKVLADVFIFYIIFVELIKSNSLKHFFSKNTVFILLVLCYIVEITMIGNRGFMLRIALLSVLLYTNFYRKIKPIYLVSCMIGGMFLLFFVGKVRGGGEFSGFVDNDMPPILQMGQDLIINNRSLYVLMEYRDKFGVNFGQTWLMNILSIIPFAQSIFLKITGLKELDISSAALVTDLYFRENNEDVFGLGTNLIGDIYICGGLLGVVFFMYLLGSFLSKVYMKGQKGDMLYWFIYAMMFMDSIILTRSTYLTSVRPIMWGLALYYFAKKRIVYKEEKKDKEEEKIEEESLVL